MRYSQADAIVSNILQDKKFNELSVFDKSRVIDRLRSEIMGRMMEEIVLLETKLSLSDKQVFKLQFAVGEFDMVIFDPDKLCCEIFEIKHSAERVPEQYRHLIDEEKCKAAEHHYGTITGKYVIYRGETTDSDGIRYLNVEEY